MDDSSLYIDRPDLQTADEIEDNNYQPNSSRLPDLPDAVRKRLVLECLASPEAEFRAEFEVRPPAMGLTMRMIDEMLALNQDPRFRPVQQRFMFRLVREKMLRYLIPCVDCTTLQQLCDILKAEITSGVPSPVPSWYKFSTVTMGPRRIGYYACSWRECYKTEHYDSPPFQKCGACSVPQYCSKDCQRADWNARHKVVCKKAKREREQTTSVGSMLQSLSDLSLTGQWPEGEGGDINIAELIR